MTTTVVHIDGFYDGDVKRVDGMNVSVCPAGESPYDAFCRIRSNIHHFGGEVEKIRRTVPLGGGPAVAIEWESPTHGKAAHMWHMVTTAPADAWARKP